MRATWFCLQLHLPLSVWKKRFFAARRCFFATGLLSLLCPFFHRFPFPFAILFLVFILPAISIISVDKCFRNSWRPSHRFVCVRNGQQLVRLTSHPCRSWNPLLVRPSEHKNTQHIFRQSNNCNCDRDRDCDFSPGCACGCIVSDTYEMICHHVNPFLQFLSLN